MKRKAIMAGLMFVIVLGAGSCHRDRAAENTRLTASNALTERFAQSRLAQWNVHASTGGTGCDVLIVETSTILADAMVEALHYGTGAYAVYENGVQQFYRDHSFRAVVYRDSTGRIWTYGAITPAAAEALAPCR